MKHLVKAAGLSERISIDSAGTGSWHVGHPPDGRSAAVAARRGIPLGGRARQVTSNDFKKFDYILALDRSNREDLMALAGGAPSRARIHLLRDFEPGRGGKAGGDESRGKDVPDPYYGDPEGFEEVFEICLAACAGLLEELKRRHSLP